MNKEQFHGWKNLPATLEVMVELTNLRLSLADSLSRGNTLCTTTDETALLTAKIVGEIEGIDQTLNYDRIYWNNFDQEDEVEEEE